jgi:predicted transcriptional regulator of viral defense system
MRRMQNATVNVAICIRQLAMKKDAIHDFIDSLQARGQYYFLKRQLLEKTGQAEKVANRSLGRQQAKNRVLLVRRGFYIIIPIEFRRTGVLPPEWFIHNLMDSLNVDYYVGLLSAAAIWGASHQKPQEFHVLTHRQFRSIRNRTLKIRFFRKLDFPDPVFLKSQKTETGFIRVSSPELTALDLVRYSKAVGGLSLVATTLAELGENIEPRVLLNLARNEKSLAPLRRLGLILDSLGYGSRTNELAELVRKKTDIPVLLDPSLPRADSRWIRKWNIFENLKIEADEI